MKMNKAELTEQDCADLRLALWIARDEVESSTVPADDYVGRLRNIQLATRLEILLERFDKEALNA